jgi:hypothetical protein
LRQPAAEPAPLTPTSAAGCDTRPNAPAFETSGVVVGNVGDALANTNHGDDEAAVDAGFDSRDIA